MNGFCVCTVQQKTLVLVTPFKAGSPIKDDKNIRRND